MYVHLTAHSAYSLQEGLALPGDLARAAAAAGMPALGLTDRRLLTGAIEFVKACRTAGVQPVLGLEVDLPAGTLSLLAMSLEGWSNLCRLSSSLALRESPEATCPIDTLARYAGDLIALYGDEGGQWESLTDIFANRLYVALRTPDQARSLSRTANRLGLPTVVTHPVYYLTPAQATLQRTLAAIRRIEPLSDLPEHAVAPAEAYFTTAAEMAASFPECGAALEASQEIAARCKFDLPIGRPHMPTVPLPPGLNASQLLRQKAEAGARRLYGDLTPPVQERLNHELDVIARMGFEPIFLIVEDLLDYAREVGVPFSSRGSAASSLVAHCLGITSPDPLRLNLYFERFLNPARSTPPDIDTDLCSRRRDAVIQHVFDTYGVERVAMVATINHYRPRSSLGDVAKAHSLSPEQIRTMANQLPYGFWARFQEGQADEGGQVPASAYAELRAAYTSPAHQRVFDEAEALLRLPRHLSVHPGGVVVAPGQLTDLVPVMRSGAKGVIITQFDLESVEALGLVKIDMLGIRGLTVLGDVAEAIQAGQGDLTANPLAVLESIAGDDPETSDRLESGATIGNFQVESPGMRATLREIHARTQDDLMAALALYRPGPLSGGLKDAFVKRYQGLAPVEHLHPALASVLGETFGVILYQEQVLRIAHDLAGFSLAEADLLRRAMSHFDPGRQMQALEHKFVAEAQARSGVPADIGEQIWAMIAAFSGYGFPKAHAASYAQVAWRSAWCKTHFPGEFMAGVLANWGGYYSQRVYVMEARRLGLGVRAPHVNFSRANFSYGEDGQGGRQLFMGLDQVRELTRRTIDHIVREQPFHSMDDFLVRVDPRPQEAADLVRVGALEGLGPIPRLLKRAQAGRWRVRQPSLFDSIDEGEQGGGNEDWTLAHTVAAQEALLGISLAAHPLELAVDKIKAAHALNTLEAAERVGQRVTVAGVRQSGHHSRTAKGEAMMFMTLEDLAGMLDVVLFPDAYRRAKDFIHGSGPLLVTGVVERDASRLEPLLRAETVVALDDAARQASRPAPRPTRPG